MNPGIKGPTFYGAMDTCLSVTCSHQSEPPPPPPHTLPPQETWAGGGRLHSPPLVEPRVSLLGSSFWGFNRPQSV